MTRNENQMYSDITSIRKSLEKIANALDKDVKYKVKDNQLVPDIPGFEGTLDALDNLYQPSSTRKAILEQQALNRKIAEKENNLCNVSTKDEEYDDDVHNDYLNDLIQDMNHIEYLNFHHDMAFGFASSDTAALNDHIYELEYEECLDAIQRALLITGNDEYLAYAGGDEEAGRNFVIERIKQENTTQPENDPYTYEPNPNRDKGEPALLEYVNGIKNDSDHDIRSTAKFYEDEYLKKEGATKKECILDYVTNEFGSHGARYSEIIKFCYYLGASNTLIKYNATRDRGYYACAFATRFGGHLIQGGRNQLVKGINNEGNERYFALSEVESFTEYWKRIS